MKNFLLFTMISISLLLGCIQEERELELDGLHESNSIHFGFSKSLVEVKGTFVSQSRSTFGESKGYDLLIKNVSINRKSIKSFVSIFICEDLCPKGKFRLPDDLKTTDQLRVNGNFLRDEQRVVYINSIEVTSIEPPNGDDNDNLDNEQDSSRDKPDTDIDITEENDGGSSLFIGAQDVLVFGDSWSLGYDDQLQTVLKQNDINSAIVHGFGKGGSTSEDWASELLSTIKEKVSSYNTTHVLLSLGGNDFQKNRKDGDQDDLMDRIESNIRIILDEIRSIDSSIRIMMTGYDFMNFEHRPECQDSAAKKFGPYWSTLAINTELATVVGSVLEKIDLSELLFDYINVYGTLQKAAGIENAPDFSLPTPNIFYPACIHPTKEGYKLIMESMFHGYHE